MQSVWSSSAAPSSSPETHLRVVSSNDSEKWSGFALVGVLVFAVVTRVLSASKYYFTDEGMVFANTYTFAFNHTLIPDNTYYPSFYALLAAPFTWLWTQCLMLAGIIPSETELDFLLSMHSRIPLMPARMLSVLSGVLTVYVTYLIGKQVYGKWCGIIGALVLSLSVLHVHQSGYGLPDVMTSLFAACAMLFTMKALDSASFRDYVWAGVFVGLTTTTKYNGVLIAFGLIIVHLIHLVREKKVWRPLSWIDHRVLGSAGASVIVFLLGTPGLLIDFAAYQRTFLKMQGKVMGQSTGLPFDFFSWQIFENLSYWDNALVGFSVLGIVYGMIRGGAARWVLVSVLLFSLSHMSTWIFQSPHYFLFLTPIYSVLAGALLFDFTKQASTLAVSRRGRSLLQVSLLALLLAWPTTFALAYSKVRSKADNRDIALRWFHKRVPAGAKIVFDWQIYQPKWMSAESYFAYLSSGDAGFRQEYLATSKHYIGIPMVYSHQWLSDVEADYLVTSSPIYTRYIKRGRSRSRFYLDLLNRPEEFGWKKVREFANGGEVGLIVFKRKKEWKRELSK